MKDKALISTIAKERIGILISSATEAQESGEQELAKKYIKMARQISLHYKIKDERLKKLACKDCNTLLIPGKTCKVIVVSAGKAIIYRCSTCGKDTKRNYRKHVRK